ncbi:MAG TPA: DUF3597 domain-containing protein [Bacillus bacterium]|uniref:N-acetylmuramoyl-L-alanine amidase n=1 Tax=Siminovitchia fordii TaxID=254759 RepID=UPI00037EA4BB|nr:N-acetylmuramoyl-L-alanine amidase [Siminovitchia fordii]HBZ09102.1 DUF3597 domain-containing protein [Bacillus sp. (in: firmicutes)]
MSVKIKQQLVSQNVIKKRSYGYGNPCRYITIHETANENTGAGAQTHANLQSNLNPRQASWQYQVDDKGVIQSFPDTVMCWAGGDGNGPGNRQSIHIELCVNNDSSFKKTVQNAAALVKHLMAKHRIPISNVVQHNRWSGKDCPHYLRNGEKGINWFNFISMVKGNEVKVEAPKTQVGSAKEGPKKPTGGYTGDSIVDYLNSIKVDSSFANRTKLAAQHGISNYRGTAAQNLQLLNKLRASGKTSATAKSAAKKGNKETDSIVDYLKSIDVNSSFANRKKLAAKHGIKNYTGTAAQNTQLLKKLRG